MDVQRTARAALEIVVFGVGRSPDQEADLYVSGKDIRNVTIRLQTRPDQPVSHAIVVDNDVTMSAPDGTVFGVTSAVIEIRGPGRATWC